MENFVSRGKLRYYTCMHNIWTFLIQISLRGEVSVLATLRRRNNDKDILAEQVERGYQVDILCNCEQYEIACALVCGGPYSYDLTKLASDEFNLPRIMKDMLDDLEMKFLYSGKNGMELYIVEIQVQKLFILEYI